MSLYEAEALERIDIGRWMDEFFNTSIFGFSTLAEVEIHESKDSYVMEVDLPGLVEKDVEVKLENGLLVISSGKENADFLRRFVVPADVDKQRISRELRNGKLILSFPKNRAEAL